MGGRDLWDERAEAGAERDEESRAQRPVAVALQYDPGLDDAPRVVATGRGHIAEQILELAFAHGVKVRTDPDLVQVLAAVDVDTVIPVEAFVAVAEVLAYVYRANSRMSPAPAAEGRTSSSAPAADRP